MVWWQIIIANPSDGVRKDSQFPDYFLHFHDTCWIYHPSSESSHQPRVWRFYSHQFKIFAHPFGKQCIDPFSIDGVGYDAYGL